MGFSFSGLFFFPSSSVLKHLLENISRCVATKKRRTSPEEVRKGVSLCVRGGGRGSSLSVIEYNLQPAGAAADELSGVALAPALHEADLDRETGPWLLAELVVVGPLQADSLLVVEGFYGEAGEHLVHQQRARRGVVQCGRLDEDGVAAAVVHPNAVRFATQLDAVADFGPDHLYQLAAAVRGELAQAEARALR